MAVPWTSVARIRLMAMIGLHGLVTARGAWDLMGLGINLFNKRNQARIKVDHHYFLGCMAECNLTEECCLHGENDGGHALGRGY